ncbi:MAG TPA: tetratricopeptide repeat protein [Thermoanaerobaculia bacterium]
MRRHAPWITLIVLGAAVLVALRAPAIAPPANLDAAITSQRALAAERPGDPQILNDLGNLLLLAGDMEEAEQAYRDALGLDPEMTSARYNLALLLAQTERPGLALEELEIVVEAQPENAWAHYQIGAILDARGADRRAIKRYATALRLDPQLAFPELNPHVIENEHLTAAMLHAYRDLPLAAQAPKTYERPSRIVDLLVPSQPAPAADTVADGEAAPGEPRSQATYAPGAAQAAGQAAGEAGAPGENGERVLRQNDLEQGGSVNQIVVPGYVPPRGGTRVQPGQPTFTPPGRVRQNDGRGATPGQPGGTPRFVPGVPSTGRLEIELFPVEDVDRETLAAAG